MGGEVSRVDGGDDRHDDRDEPPPSDDGSLTPVKYRSSSDEEPDFDSSDEEGLLFTNFCLLLNLLFL